jgi:hypothetical protein
MSSTQAETQARYRKRKAAAEFSQQYKNILGHYPTVDDFIEAKLVDETPEYSKGATSLDGAFSREFYGALEEYDNEWLSEYLDADELNEEDDERLYSVANMLEAWAVAQQEFNSQEEAEAE